MKLHYTAILLLLATSALAQEGAPEVTTEAVESKSRLCTVQAENADVTELVWSIAKQASANLVVAPEVQGRVTLRLREVAWPDALRAAVESLGHRVEIDPSGITRVR